ncbi:hypothetical protein [Lactobacillus johnsonii]|uniref:Uncharacterized protein n=1 Tax=Lactobacillus johnsonii TaxID=33959 RepID=A0A9X5ALB3_LACJH|nr:hypothetical protein [Lactobacillus johnsonii]MTE02738.1 hypothetical protein [Lactobacillus johnsonii]
MKKSEQLSLDEGFYEFKDTNILNRINKVKSFVSEIKEHNMLTPEDYQEMLDLTEDLEDVISDLFDYLLLTRNQMF